MRRSRERWFYWIITPWLLGFLLLHVLPALGTILFAFFEWDLPGAARFVGLDHFRQILTDPVFRKALLNTGLFSLVTVPASTGLGLALAALLYRRAAGVRFFRTVFLLPAVVPGVATALTWAWMLNPRFGPVNRALALLGVSGPAWLHEPQLALPVVMLVHLWTAGINMVVYLAALQNLPGELFDAARIDGANSRQRFRHLTRPLLSPITFYLVIVNLIGTFQVFTPIYILTGGGPDNATLTLPLYIYWNAFRWGHLGYAAALSSLLLAAVVSLSAVLFRLANRSVFYPG